ncbi:MAG TPA: nucleotidyltransferase domain-containing protein [Anaerolineae bacterium]|nr:nucleotidyltransferase domain-containing protein [Anaerolineae bacterium]
MVISKREVKAATDNVKSKEGTSLLTKISTLLEGREEVVFAYLFGSRSLGYSRPDSDIDLAVFFGNGAKWARMELEEKLSQGLRLPVQVVSLNEELAPRFLQNILSTGVVVKDNPSRKDWERKIQESEQERERKEMEQNYKEQLLHWMEEKVELILKALPLLDGINLEEIKRENLEAMQAFLGAFSMLFEPLETIARRMTSYARLTLDIKEEPVTLREQMALTMEILKLDDETRDRFNGIIELRNKLAHAYWEITKVPFPLDMKEMREAFERLAGKVRGFIASERERLG